MIDLFFKVCLEFFIKKRPSSVTDTGLHKIMLLQIGKDLNYEKYHHLRE